MKKPEKKSSLLSAPFCAGFRSLARNCAVIAMAVFAVAAFSSCASVLGGTSVKVNAFDTLERDSNAYIRIPVNVHSELTNNLLKAVIGSDISEKYVKNITDSIDMIYLGVGSSSDKGRLQVACDGNISSATKLALSSMENWKKEIKNVNTAGMYTVYTEANSKIQLCVPGSNLICLSKNLTPQLTLYDKEASSQGIASVLTGSTSNKNATEWKSSEVYKFVGDTNTSNVRIYMDTPIAFVTNLLGVSLSTSIFQLNFLEAELKLLPTGKYSIDIDMEFQKDGLVAKAAAFLNVALLLADSKVSITDNSHLKLSGIQVSIAQLQKMLSL